jgi:integrase
MLLAPLEGRECGRLNSSAELYVPLLGFTLHSLRKTAINDAIRNGAAMHEVREFAGHSDIRTTELYFVRKEEDGEVAARRIQIRLTGRKGE